MPESGTIDLRRSGGTTQNIYSNTVIQTSKELFGEESVEYGLALSGAFQLHAHLKKYFTQTFSPEEVVYASEGNTAILEKAQWLLKVKQLIDIVEACQRGKQQPPWFADAAI